MNVIGYRETTKKITPKYYKTHLKIKIRKFTSENIYVMQKIEVKEESRNRKSTKDILNQRADVILTTSKTIKILNVNGFKI